MKNLHKYFHKTTFLLIIIILLVNCRKESNAPTPVVIKDAADVNKFIYNGLKDYYLWVDQIPNLTNQKYTVKDSLNAFLNTFTDPNKLFNNLLYQYGTIDKWSFIVDDSQVITNWLQGISQTMGFECGFAQIGTSNNLFGYVWYIYKGSPAEKAGMKRGDLFM